LSEYYGVRTFKLISSTSWYNERKDGQLNVNGKGLFRQHFFMMCIPTDSGSNYLNKNQTEATKEFQIREPASEFN
jgi:hypothetical protein